MGTSSSRATPSGSRWTSVKRRITASLYSGAPGSASPIVAQTIAAAGGFGGFGGGSGGGGGGGASLGSIGNAIAGLGGFGAVARDAGLGEALRVLGLADLHGKSAIEIVSRIAERLSEGATESERELLQNALNAAIFDAAALAEDTGFEDLEAGLGTYLGREGPEGLVELFLTNFVFVYVWSLDEEHVQTRSADEAASEAFQAAIRHACESEVRSYMQLVREAGRMNQVDWFGAEGRRIGTEIASDLAARFLAQAEV